jgi:hypothetical protein
MNPLFLILAGCLLANNTDYQAGFYDGAVAGMCVGSDPGNETACDQFNDLLIQVFGSETNVFGLRDYRITALWRTPSRPANPFGINEEHKIGNTVYSPGWLGAV